MRVIAGTYRSRLLKSLKGLALRPTSDRLRQLPTEWQRRYHLARIG
jgi:16S rRNA G966 N2-methylase RsmD